MIKRGAFILGNIEVVAQCVGEVSKFKINILVKTKLNLSFGRNRGTGEGVFNDVCFFKVCHLREISS